MRRTLYALFLFLCAWITPHYVEATATIIGTVADSVTGTPISGALIKAIRGSQVRYAAITAGDGSYTLAGIEPSNYTLVASASGYQTQSVGVKPRNNQTTVVDFDLIPIGGTLAGTVTNASTLQPISGANVYIFQGIQLVTSTTTNGSGAYSVPNLAPGNYIILTRASGFRGQFKSANVQAGVTTTVNFTLSPLPGTISGKVTDSLTGSPIAGALIEIFDGNVIVGFADTDINGNYSIPDLDPGNYIVICSAATYATKFVGATVVSNTTTTVNFALDRNPGTIEGTVTNAADGIGIRAATVTVYQGHTLISSTLTDPDGNYSFPGLAPGNYIVIADAPNFSISILGAMVSSGTTTIVDFALTVPVGAISGRVIDATTLNPIPNAAVNVYEDIVLIASSITDVDGNYDVPNLEPDTYNVVVLAAGYQDALKRGTVTANQTTTVDFSLSSHPGTIAGTVTDQASNPIPGTAVAVFQDSTFIEFALTDVNGNYTISNLAPGNYIVLAIASGYSAAFSSQTVVADTVTIANFVLNTNSGAIVGRITEACAGLPVPGAIILVKEGSIIVGFDVSDSDGMYSVSSLAPESYTVTAGKRGFIIGNAPAIVISNMATTVNILLMPRALPPASISGRVLKNTFLTQTDRIHAIAWKASPGLCVKGYLIFRNGKQIAFISASSKLKFLDHNRPKRKDVYTVKTVNTFGEVSSGIDIILK